MSEEPVGEGTDVNLSEVAADATDDGACLELGPVPSDLVKTGLAAYQPRLSESAAVLSRIVADAYRPQLLETVSGFSKMFADSYRSPLLEIASGYSKMFADSYRSPLLEIASKHSKMFADTYRPQLLESVSGLSKMFADTYRPQFAAILSQFGSAIATPTWANMTGFGSLPRHLHILAISNPITSQVGHFVSETALEFSGDGQNAKSSSLGIRNREIAAMLTVTVFLFVYIVLGLAIKHNPELAKLAVTDGPTPFEAAMAAGAFTFWAWMTYSNRSSDD